MDTNMKLALMASVAAFVLILTLAFVAISYA